MLNKYSSNSLCIWWCRAAQKVGASSKKKKHRPGGKEKQPMTASFPTNFATVLLKNPPPVPRNLLRPIGRTQSALSGKVVTFAFTLLLLETPSTFSCVELSSFFYSLVFRFVLFLGMQNCQSRGPRFQSTVKCRNLFQRNFISTCAL